MCSCGQRKVAQTSANIGQQTVTPAETPQSTPTEQNQKIAQAAIGNTRS